MYDYGIFDHIHWLSIVFNSVNFAMVKKCFVFIVLK